MIGTEVILAAPDLVTNGDEVAKPGENLPLASERIQ